VLDVSILIVHYKTLQLTTNCIRSIYEHTEGISFEVIVVDNDSQDGAGPIILQQFPSVKWVETGYNAGFSRANNAGMRVASGRYMLLLNSDTLLIDNVIARSVERMDARPDVAASAAIQLHEDRTPRPFYTGWGDYLEYFFIVPLSLQTFAKRFFKNGTYDDPEQVDWLTGAYLLVRQTAIDQVGMMEEDFFMYGEDVEWSCRLREAGKLLVFRNCQFIHFEWGSAPNRIREGFTYINRFDEQIHLSNLVWMRKVHGVLPYLGIMAYYWLMVPIIYIWKVLADLKQGKNPLVGMFSQHEYTRKTWLFTTFMPRILRNKRDFYKVARKR
jgi:GT2 family glycosyltransferase